MESPRGRGPVAAALAGAGVGILGGLLGLGGAEFRLPLLVTLFRSTLRRAVSLNLAISFVAVVGALVARWALAKQMPMASVAAVAVCMVLGGMTGAALGARWLARISDERLHAAVRALLVSIGLLLIAESATPWISAGLSIGPVVGGVVAMFAGVIIGAVSTILGVAGGELIIPTLVLLFSVPIKAAGTTSLLISIPMMLVALARHRARRVFQEVTEVRRVVVPMGLGTVVGSAAGGVLIAYAPAGAVKVLLGVVLIASALRVFRARSSTCVVKCVIPDGDATESSTASRVGRRDRLARPRPAGHALRAMRDHVRRVRDDVSGCSRRRAGASGRLRGRPR